MCGVVNPKKTCVHRRLHYMRSNHGNHSRLNSEHDWGGLYEHLMNTWVFNLVINIYIYIYTYSKNYAVSSCYWNAQISIMFFLHSDSCPHLYKLIKSSRILLRSNLGKRGENLAWDGNRWYRMNMHKLRLNEFLNGNTDEYNFLLFRTARKQTHSNGNSLSQVQ